MSYLEFRVCGEHRSFVEISVLGFVMLFHSRSSQTLQHMCQVDQMSLGGGMGQQQPTSSSVGPVGGGAPGPPGPPGSGGFPQSMAPLNPSAPGSPARAFPVMGAQPSGGNPGFNPMPSLNSQFQSKCMHMKQLSYLGFVYGLFSILLLLGCNSRLFGKNRSL